MKARWSMAILELGLDVFMVSSLVRSIAEYLDIVRALRKVRSGCLRVTSGGHAGPPITP
jgi:hypothetical protein